MKPRAVIRPLARHDLLEQAEYIAFHSGLAMASRFLKAADGTYQLIATQPCLGRLVERFPPAMSGSRVFPVRGFGKHLVFYRPVEDGIEILRVIHGARDIEALFEE